MKKVIDGRWMHNLSKLKIIVRYSERNGTIGINRRKCSLLFHSHKKVLLIKSYR